MNCDKCKSTRIISIDLKAEPLSFEIKMKDKWLNYVPYGINIDGMSHWDDVMIEFEYCADCGKIQGNFPLKEIVALEKDK